MPAFAVTTPRMFPKFHSIKPVRFQRGYKNDTYDAKYVYKLLGPVMGRVKGAIPYAKKNNNKR